MRFSKHSIERLIQRLKTKEPRIEVAKAIDVEVKGGRVKNFHKNTLTSFFELVGSIYPSHFKMQI